MGTATEIEETECIHGMEPAWCSICKPQPKKTTVKDRLDTGDYDVLTRYELVDGPGSFVEQVRLPSGKRYWVAYGLSGRTLWSTRRAAANHLSAEL